MHNLFSTSLHSKCFYMYFDNNTTDHMMNDPHVYRKSYSSLVSDMCVIQAPNSYSFDRKQIAMAKTDCEVILAGDCGSSSKEVLVTIKPASNQDRTAERVSSASCHFYSA